MTTSLEAFVRELTESLGAEAVAHDAATLTRYGENTLPAGPREPACVLYPGSTADVQAMVRAAIRHHVALYPLSTGNNIGLGSRAPVRAGHVVLDLGRRMNRILEVDDALGIAVIEPGVSFQMLHDELVRRGDKLMVSATSGPPHGGIIGNALDKGAGYGPYFDHFGMLCGMEVVLGTGEIIRTGDGSLEAEKLLNFHTSKYSFGPVLDGLFAQSNFGIVTRAGLWLMPRPPHVESFHVLYPEDEDLEQIIDLVRPLKMSNFVPTLFRVTNDIYAASGEARSPEYRPGIKSGISDAGRRALRQRAGLGAWQVSAAFYGASAQAVAPQIERMKAHFGAGGRTTFVSHAEAVKCAPLKVAIDAMSGRPGVTELGMLDWRPGGGNAWFLPGTPMVGRHARELDHIARAIYAEHGMDFMVMHVASARFARGLHVLSWNRGDADENRRADECYRTLATEFAKRGVGVGRAPLDWQEMHAGLLMPAFRETVQALKRAMDPHGVLAPGRYGID